MIVLGLTCLGGLIGLYIDFLIRQGRQEREQEAQQNFLRVRAYGGVSLLPGEEAF